MNRNGFTALKSILALWPFLHRLGYKMLYRLTKRQLTWKAPTEGARSIDVFDRIYTNNIWGSEESASGLGSTKEATAMIRASLPKLFSDLSVTSVLDAPCGDFNWMRHTDLSGIKSYTGGDIVGDLVGSLKRQYEDDKHHFIQFDILTSDLPKVDLWICREALFHFPSKNIIEVLRRFRDSSIDYILTTTFDFPSSNPDIEFGDFRMLNLRIPPFSLPRPMRYLDDFAFPEAPRRLGLWSRRQLQGWNPR